MDVIQYILQMRYDNRRSCTTFVTTNLFPEEIHLKYGEYIADRVNEMFNVVEIGGKKSKIIVSLKTIIKNKNHERKKQQQEDDNQFNMNLLYAPIRKAVLGTLMTDKRLMR